MDETKPTNRDLALLQKQIEQAKEQLQAVMRSQGNAEQAVKDAEAKLVQLQSQIDQQQQRADQFTDRINDQAATLDQQNEEIGSNNQLIATLQTQKDGMEASCNEKKAAADRDLAGYLDRTNAEKAAAGKELADVTSQLTEAQTALATTTAAYDAKTDDYNALVSAVQALTKERDSLDDQSRVLTDAVASFTAKLQAAQDELAQVQSDAAGIQRKLDVDTKAHQDQIDALNTEIADLTAQRNQVKTDLSEKVAEFERKKQQLFAIADRQQQLDQREAYIKDKYQKAGVPYEETDT